jgi:hypothetical protein
MSLCLNINYQGINFCNTDSNVSIYIYALHSAQYIGCPSHTHTHTHIFFFFLFLFPPFETSSCEWLMVYFVVSGCRAGARPCGVRGTFMRSTSARLSVYPPLTERRTCCSVHTKPSQEYRSLVLLFMSFSTSTSMAFLDMAKMHLTG